VRALRALGMDGAVTYTFLARSAGVAGSAGTVLLILRRLSPVEQGYYYTLLGLVSLQLVFELGFSFVIQQMAAHECAHLELHPGGRIEGDPVAHARLASTLRLSLRWYTVAAVAMCIVLAPLGMVFFSRRGIPAGPPIPWQGPWLAAVFASSASLWCMPLYSFLEGCGYVRAVAAMRLRQSVATSACAWIPLLLGHGLYSPAMAIVGYLGAGLLYVLSHRRLLLGLARHKGTQKAVRWMREIWPFQWRIAVSWICSYFTVQILVPMLFALRGPVEAGQMGMSLSITGYVTLLALAWSTTKTTPFGNLIARRELKELDRLFRRTLGQSMAVFALVALAVCVSAVLLSRWAPRLAARVVSPHLFALLMLAAAANCLVQSLAILLRSFKAEPFLIQSLAVAALTLALAALAAPRWGNAGAALGYLAATLGVGLPLAVTIFLRARRGYLGVGKVETMVQPCQGV